jgi:hypothetical protein
MGLCKLCSSISFETLPSLPICYGSSLELGPDLIMHTPDPSEHRPERFGFQHQQDLEALEKSSISCPLCSLIYEGVNKFVWNVANGERTGSNGQAYPTIGPKDYRLQVTKPFENLDGFIIWTDATEHGYIFLVAAVGLCVKDGATPLDSIISVEFMIHNRRQPSCSSIPRPTSR